MTSEQKLRELIADLKDYIHKLGDEENEEKQQEIRETLIHITSRYLTPTPNKREAK
jgi:hypothetical protein